MKVPLEEERARFLLLVVLPFIIVVVGGGLFDSLDCDIMLFVLQKCIACERSHHLCETRKIEVRVRGGGARQEAGMRWMSLSHQLKYQGSQPAETTLLRHLLPLQTWIFGLI